MLLILTCSQDGTSDLLLPFLREIRVFRLDIDRYADYRGDGVPEDYTEAVKWYRPAAEQGHTKAQQCMGRAYRDGCGVPKDEAEAARWFNMTTVQAGELQ